MRLKISPSVCAMVRTNSVLAVPGKPVIRQWPPTNREIMTCSSTSSWPTITRRTCVTISDCTWRKRAIRDFKTSESNCCGRVVDMVSPFSVLIFLGGGAQFQQQLLGGPEPGCGFQGGQQFFFRRVGLVVGIVCARQIVMRL